MKPMRFAESVDNWIKTWDKPINELQKNKTGIDDDFFRIEKERIKYKMYSNLNDYKK